MPRIRSIKPEALQHRKVGRLSDRAFRLWVGMLTQADDEGRLVVDPDNLRVLCFGYHPKVKIEHVSAALNEILGLGLIRLYGISQTIYADFPSWADHQVVNRPAPSFIAPYSAGVPITEYSLNGQGSYQHDLTRPDLTRSDPTRSDPACVTPALAHREEFEQFWTFYPNKTAKGYAHTCFLKAIKKVTLQVMLEALALQIQWPKWQRDGGQYIPNPSTWLNQERWNDEVGKGGDRGGQKRRDVYGRVGSGDAARALREFIASAEKSGELLGAESPGGGPADGGDAGKDPGPV